MLNKEDSSKEELQGCIERCVYILYVHICNIYIHIYAYIYILYTCIKRVAGFETFGVEDSKHPNF